MRTARTLLPLVCWLGLLGVATAVLVLIGRSGLRTPSVLEPAAWPAWASGRDPLDIAFAVLRLVGLAAAWYLVGATTIGTLARLLRWARLVEVADALTVAWVRNLLQGALGLGLATAAVTGATISPAMAGGDSAAGGPSVMAEAPVSAAVSGVAISAHVPNSESETMRQLPPAIAPETVARGDHPGSHTGGDPVAKASSYTVRPGDHFWSIAERALLDAWGRAPSDAEITPVWKRLIAANRDKLVDPGNPDLLLPGQDLTIPALPTVS
jgi:hypothetical protein